MDNGQSYLQEVRELLVTFSEALSTEGGNSGAHSVTNPANWIVANNGVVISDAIEGITHAFNTDTQQYEVHLSLHTLSAGDYRLTATDNITDLAGNPLDTVAIIFFHAIPGGRPKPFEFCTTHALRRWVAPLG